MKNLVCLLLLLMSSVHVDGQSTDFRKQRVQLFVFNAGFNGLVGGVGSLINKQANVSGFRAFTKGFYKGAIGGAISHTGLSLTHQIQTKQNIAYAWPARLINSFGSSIIQNAAENRRMFERLHLNLFVTRLEYYPYQQRLSARLFTSSLYGILIVGKNARFDLKKSLQTGILYFESNQNFRLAGLGRSSIAATGQVSSIGMTESLTGDDFYNVYAEEVAHILQYDRKVGGNALLLKAHQHFNEKSKAYSFLSKYIYFDLNGPVFWLAYKMEGSDVTCNFFEQEAIHYSYRSALRCN